MGDLSGKVAVVTGGSRGLGAATALALAEAGADVAVLARDSGAVTTVAEMIRQKGRKGLGIAADVGSWQSVRDAVAQVHDALGPVTILVNSAALNTPFATIAMYDPAEWDRAIAVDLNGPFYCARATLPDMLAANWGRVINISSGAAVGAIPGLAAYSVAKAGLDHLTRILAAELAQTGVAAITVYPGIMNTQMQTFARDQPSPTAAMFQQYHAQGWLRPPEESAALIRWLCGPAGEQFRGTGADVHSTAIRRQIGLPDLPEPLRRP